jgi:molybdate transport system ATP-binding protein
VSADETFTFESFRDDALGALDEERKREILPYLVRLRDEIGISMVYVSHDAAEWR